MENKPFLLFVAIPLSIFILYIIWLKLSGKGIFRKEEDKPDEEA